MKHFFYSGWKRWHPVDAKHVLLVVCRVFLCARNLFDLLIVAASIAWTISTAVCGLCYKVSAWFYV